MLNNEEMTMCVEARALVDAVNGMTVIDCVLTGSRAYGTPDEHSDTDILIVVNVRKKDWDATLMRPVYAALRRYLGQDMDFYIVYPQQIHVRGAMQSLELGGTLSSERDVVEAYKDFAGVDFH